MTGPPPPPVEKSVTRSAQRRRLSRSMLSGASGPSRCRKPCRQSAYKQIPRTNLPRSLGTTSSGTGTTGTGDHRHRSRRHRDDGHGDHRRGNHGRRYYRHRSRRHGDRPAFDGCSDVCSPDPSWHPVEFVTLSYSLNCDPTSGTLIDPGAACAAIAQNPNMFVARPPVGCLELGASFSISGVYDGRDVDVGFTECADVELGGWASFLPTEKTLSEVSINHGIGPFTLGESESAAQGLVSAGAAIGTAGGLDVYKPSGGLPGLVSGAVAGPVHKTG